VLIGARSIHFISPEVIASNIIFFTNNDLLTSIYKNDTLLRIFMLHKLNIILLLVFIFNPMLDLKADTIDLNEEIEDVWNVRNVSPDSSEVVASVNGWQLWQIVEYCL